MKGGGFMQASGLWLVLATGSSLALGAPQEPVGRAPSEAPAAPAQGVDRDRVHAGLEWVDPALIEALARPLNLQLQVAQMTAPYDAEGVPITDPEEYNKHLYGPDAPFREFVTERSEHFDFRGIRLPSGQFFVECLFHDEGYRAVGDLLKAQPDFDPQALLDLFNPRFLTSPSMVSGREATDYFERDGHGGGIVPLSNAGALGYLIWGLLYQEEYWAVEGRDRPAFIQNLLALGIESKQHALLVERALLAPLRIAEGEELAKHPGRGIAGPLELLRDKVGYTPAHEAFLVEDLRLAEALKEAERSSTEAADAWEADTPPVTPYLEQWTVHMLDKVREELYGSKAAKKLMRGATLMERQTYWKKLFKESRYDFARDLALAEIRAIVAGLDDHPLTPRIEELEALGMERTPEQEQELQELLNRRNSERYKLMETVSDELARSGVLSHYDLTLQTLLVDLDKALEGASELWKRNLVESAWGAMAMVGQPRTMETLLDHFAGGLELPGPAVSCMILNTAAYEYSGSRALLEEVLMTGTLAESRMAIVNSGWMTAKEHKQAFEDLIARAELTENQGFACASTFSALVESLDDQTDSAYRKQMLLKTMEGGKWVDPSAPGYWDITPEHQGLGFIKSQFSAKELAKLVKQGKVPSWLLD